MLLVFEARPATAYRTEPAATALPVALAKSLLARWLPPVPNLAMKRLLFGPPVSTPPPKLAPLDASPVTTLLPAASTAIAAAIAGAVG
jgi:hypothetical protein